MTTSQNHLFYLLETESASYYFISDLHLSPENQLLINKFKAFITNEALENREKPVRLYILGDLFDFWIGDDAAERLGYNDILHYIHSLTKNNIDIYVMHGNRDFLLAKGFEKQSGCKLIDDPTCITVNDCKILLLHGDSLCTDDASHQKFRHISRKYFPKILAFIPVKLRLWMAQKIRKNSQNSNKSYEIMDINQQSLDDLLAETKPDMVIHGHTHKPLWHDEVLNGRTIQRLVLSDW